MAIKAGAPIRADGPLRETRANRDGLELIRSDPPGTVYVQSIHMEAGLVDKRSIRPGDTDFQGVPKALRTLTRLDHTGCPAIAVPRNQSMAIE